MEFFVTEMSVTVKYPETEAPEHGTTDCSGCDQHDTSAAAAFIFRVLGEISGPEAPDALSWWTFSDVFQEHNITRVLREQGLPQTEFSSAYGLQTISGVRKPGWRAFELLHQSGDTKVDLVTVAENEEADTPGAALNESSPFHAFATMNSSAPDGLSSTMVFVSLWGNPWNRGAPHHDHPPHQVTSNHTATIKIVYDAGLLTTPPTTIFATRIDEQNSNPQAAWKAMGSPAKPSAAQLQALHAASELRPQELPLDTRCPNPTNPDNGRGACLSVKLELAPNTAVLLSFKKPTSSSGSALKTDDNVMGAVSADGKRREVVTNLSPQVVVLSCYLVHWSCC